jgi:hypothetical protein
LPQIGQIRKLENTNRQKYLAEKDRPAAIVSGKVEIRKDTLRETTDPQGSLGKKKDERTLCQRTDPQA